MRVGWARAVRWERLQQNANLALRTCYPRDGMQGNKILRFFGTWPDKLSRNTCKNTMDIYRFGRISSVAG